MTTTVVASVTELQTALAAAKAGDIVQLAAGTYANVALNNINPSAAVTITSQSTNSQAVINGMSVNNSSNLSFTNVDMSTVGLTGPTTSNQFSFINDKNISISHATVHGDPNGTLSTDLSGILIQSSQNFSIYNSSFDHLHYAIQHDTAVNINISNNVFTRIWDGGVSGGGTSNISITGNSFSSSHMDASDTEQPALIQFWTSNAKASAHDITIAGNTYARGAGAAVQGVLIQDSLNFPYQNVTIVNNTFVGALGNAIALDRLSNGVIAFNDLQAFPDAASGITLQRSSGELFTGNRSGQFLLSGNTDVQEVGDTTTAATPTTTNASVADIIAVYDNYMGRDPTAAELTTAEAGITAGGTLSALRRSLLIGVEGATHSQTAIIQIYNVLLGRNPTNSEYVTSATQIGNGEDFAGFRYGLISSAAGTAYFKAALNSLYGTYEGRAPAASEVTEWRAVLTNLGPQNFTFTDIRNALVGSAAGQAYIDSQITSYYDTYFGRDPAASEISVWHPAIANGAYDYNGLRTILLNDPAGVAHTNAQIKLLYETYFGRDPVDIEVTAWQDAILNKGYDFNAMRAFLLKDSSGIAHTNAQVKLLYETYFGRDPTASDYAAWQSALLGGYDFVKMRAFLLADPAGVAHTSAQIKLLYDTYFGRDPGASEVAAWQDVIVNGGYDFNAMRAFLLADPAGQANTTAQIKLLYDTYFGRDPSADDTAAWQNVIDNGGYDFNAMRTFLLKDPSGVAHTNAQIKLLYDTYFGRDPAASEYSAWQGAILSGYDFPRMRAFLLADPAGQAHTTAEIKQVYDTYFGRDPSASDTAAWQNVIVNAGYDFKAMQAFLLADPAGQAHLNAAITTLYDNYFARDPSASELSSAITLVNSAGSYDGLRGNLLADPVGQAHTNSEIKTLYDTYMGRDPVASEVTAWQGLIAGGYDFTGMRTALLQDPGGQAHTNAEIKSLFDTYFGRDPTASDTATWQSNILAGSDFTTLRTGLLSDPVGQAHTASEVTRLFDLFYGRDPTAAELATTESQIAAGSDFVAVQAALVATPTGHATVNAQVKTLYDTYFGRDPTASELTGWQTQIAAGSDFNSVRAFLLKDPLGVAHTTAEITTLYSTYLGRAPVAADISTWQARIVSGYDFHQMQDTLERSSGTVTHLTATPGQTSYSMGAGINNLTVDLFDPVKDTLTLSAALFGGINPLDTAHAQQITALDGTTDVLITLNATHTLLFEHTLISSLPASDFLFG